MRIGAKIGGRCADRPVFAWLRGSVFECAGRIDAGRRRSAAGRWLGAVSRRVGVGRAMRPGGSDGKRRVWRVLEFVDERLEQKNGQQMRQNPRLGGVFSKAR